MAKLTKEQTKKIADLARLELSDSELDKYSKEISSILEYVELIDEVDVSDIGFVSNLSDFEGSVLREDEPGESLDIKEVLKNATNERASENYFTTSKIL